MSAGAHREALLDELLALCLEAERLGVSVDREALLGRYPELAEELAEFWTGHDGFKRLAAPLHRANSPVASSACDAATTPTLAVGAGHHGPPSDDGCLRLGKYRLIREIGRGGMGVVYEAWQEGVNRPVAVKVISAGPFASEEELRRFRAEAEAAANLSHAGLVPIYEVDVCDGRPFYSMELVRGQSLAEFAAQGPVSCEKAASFVSAVAEAVQYAHGRGILHRDLKPANVLIDATGRPRVTDFGLAKRFGEYRESNEGENGSTSVEESRGSETLTRTGAVVGTPSYMSPEQAAGRRDVGPAADVYGLGAILYYLLTGRPPFKASSPVETLQLVVDGRVEPIRLLNADVPRDLATIVETCLAKDPADRYRTAADLADDLRRFLAGEPIRAGGLSVWGRLARAVGQSRHVSHFRYWGRTIAAFGAIVFLAHLVMHAIDRLGGTDWWVFLPPRLIMFACLVGVLRWSRSGSLLPRDAVERLVWVVWTAYLLAFAATGLVTAASGRPHVAVYPFAAVLAGMAFFTLGCHVWGACYLVGGAFFIAAPLLALLPDYAVLGFGSLWGLSLLALGLRYERLNRTLPTEG